MHGTTKRLRKYGGSYNMAELYEFARSMDFGCNITSLSSCSKEEIDIYESLNAIGSEKLSLHRKEYEAELAQLEKDHLHDLKKIENLYWMALYNNTVYKDLAYEKYNMHIIDQMDHTPHLDVL